MHIPPEQRGGVLGLVDVDVEARHDLTQGGERRVGMARVEEAFAFYLDYGGEERLQTRAVLICTVGSVAG